MPALGNALGLPYRKNGLGFVGALDAYAAGLLAIYSPFKKLIGNYNGNAVRVRRSSDNTLTTISFLSNGTFDAASYAAFIGAGSGFAHTVYDQSGNGRDYIQTTAAAQPQIGVDGNGDYYLYAPGAGFSTTKMLCAGLSIACTDFTFWTVAGAAAYAFVPINTRDNTAVTERYPINYSNSIDAIFQDSVSGTVAKIGSTNTGVYSSVWSAGSSGNKLTNRLSTVTGTRTAAACTINVIGLGYAAGGATWAQNSPWYMGAVWSVDHGPTATFAALATLGKTLIPAAQ